MPDVLQTERLLLRPWAESDLGLLSNLSSNPRVTRHVGDGLTWTAMKALAASDRWLDHWREHHFGWRVAVELQSGESVGLIGLNMMPEGTAGLSTDEYEIGWWLDPRVWGHGYATEGAAAAAADAFESLDAPELTARIAPENAASIAVAKAIGMTFEFNTVAAPGILVAIYRMKAPAIG